MHCGCKMNWLLGCLMQLVSSTKENISYHGLFSLSATVVNTLWLKQPTCFFSVLLYCKLNTRPCIYTIALLGGNA